VTPRGSGFGYVGGCVPAQGGIALSVARMKRIKEINFEDGIAVVEPGVITADLQREACERGLFYPPDPASMKDCSLGGNIATNAGGPRCLKYGVTRNYVLGLEVVLADGRVLRTGSRTHKNKTGFDLIGLFVGSEGLLGVVTEATLRLLPLPAGAGEPERQLPHLSRGGECRAGDLPRRLSPRRAGDRRRIHSPIRTRALRHGACPRGRRPRLVDLDGQAASVRAESKSLAMLLQRIGAQHIDKALGDAACERLWALRRKFSESLKATGLTKLNEDITVPRSRLVDLAEFAARLRKKHGFQIACFGHAGDGNIHTNIMAANYHTDAKVKRRVDAALDELFTQVLAWGGVITGEHGIGIAKLPWWKQATSKVSRQVHAEIKAALDPHGILNPGKFVPR
jgi:glycolate oxidase